MTSSIHRNCIFVVSTAVDLATDRVVDILAAGCTEIVRLNTEDLPYEKLITFDPDGRHVLLEGVEDGSRQQIEPSSVWFRRRNRSARASD